MRAPRIILIGGPTGTGKSEVAMRVAEKLEGEIVSADSRQFYREITIGTDKPTLSAMGRIPHHLVNCLSLSDTWNIHDFASTVGDLVRSLHARGKIPVIVGGSGLYLRSLTRGIFEIPESDRKRQGVVRAALEEMTTREIREELARIDPDIGSRIHPNDRRRMRRALEIFRLTGKPMSFWHAQPMETPLSRDGRVEYTILTRSREFLNRKISLRIRRMLEEGWIEEVRGLREAGYTQLLRTKAPIGYADILDYLDGRCPEDDLEPRIAKNTRDLAKRQFTWFRKEPGLRTDVPEGEEDMIAERIAAGEQPC